MVVELKISSNYSKKFVYASLDDEVSLYITWLAGRHSNINFVTPRKNAHLTLVNGAFDKINNEKLFKKSCSRDWGSLYSKINLENLRIQKNDLGTFCGVYANVKMAENFRSIRREFGVTDDSNYSPHFSFCNTKNRNQLKTFLNPKRYFRTFFC